MIVIPGNKIVYTDCDDTLVFWHSTPEQKEKEGVLFTCPGSMVWDVDGEEIGYANSWSEILVPNWPQIEELRKFKIRGHKIILWSAAGVEWCETIAKTLKLEDVIDVCICKPVYVIDDLPVSEFMPQSRLIKRETK
ncbi:MAG TPA: hypothetical protein VIJ14_08540 [Rhabdochlamydiaceae bacterium]